MAPVAGQICGHAVQQAAKQAKHAAGAKLLVSAIQVPPRLPLTRMSTTSLGSTPPRARRVSQWLARPGPSGTASSALETPKALEHPAEPNAPKREEAAHVSPARTRCRGKSCGAPPNAALGSPASQVVAVPEIASVDALAAESPAKTAGKGKRQKQQKDDSVVVLVLVVL